MKKAIDIADIFFWITLILLIIMLSWWAFGNSPTAEVLSFFTFAFGTALTWEGIRASRNIIRSTNKLAFDMKEQHSEQTQVLKDIRDILKRR